MSHPSSSTSSTATPSLANDPFTAEVIRRKVRQMLRRPEFAGDSADDLTQEFLARVSDAMTSHREEVGHRNPFIVMIVDRHVSTMIQHRKAAVRASERPVSLNVMIHDSEIGPTEMAQTIGEYENERRLATRRINQTDHSNLKHDLPKIIAELPAPWQEFLKLLRDHSIAEASRIMGVPRTTLNSWRHRIAEKFEEAGLRDYLG